MAQVEETAVDEDEPYSPERGGGNLVANGNFSQLGAAGAPLGWTGVDGAVFSRCTATALPGAAASLQWHGTDPNVTRIVLQRVELSGGERNRVHLAALLKTGANVLLLDEPTNDLDVDTLRALEDALVEFAGCVVVISHDRWFLDRIATHILAFEGDSQVVWFQGNYQDYAADRRRRLGSSADRPQRLKYRRLVRA